MESLNEALGLFLAALVTFALNYGRVALNDWMARKRLDSALGRAAGMVLADPAFRQAGELLLDAAQQRILTYVKDSLPDTVKALKIPDDRLLKMGLGEIGKLTGRPL